MASTGRGQEDRLVGPTHEYPSPTDAHGHQTTFYDPRSSRSFGEVEDLQMADNLSHGIQHDLGAQLESAAAMSNGHEHVMGHGPGPDLNMSTTGPPAPGMAPPPQTPGQHPPLSGPPIQRPGIDGSQEMGSIPHDSSRKRSKVSRACDECRRKKIKCDATAEDGTVNTCSNCRRINQPCSFSRVPMKRGPSKGYNPASPPLPGPSAYQDRYIKELSERVQQVESQMGMGGQSGPGYRTSMDAGSPSGIFAEGFSPDDNTPMSLKRNISFSEGRNPFAQPQFMNRDRMPSTGGWSMGSAGHTSRPQGARGSIAIAPDQQVPEIPTTVNGQYYDLSKPFWFHGFGQTLSKKRKRSPDDGEQEKPTVSALLITSESFKPYSKSLHPSLPILPEAFGDVETHLNLCSKRQQDMFALAFFSATRQKCPQLPQDYRELEEYVWSEARVHPDSRSASENIVWLWIYLFMLLISGDDLTRLRGAGNSVLGTDLLIKMAVDLGRYALKNFKQESPPESEGLSKSIIDIARQAWNCVVIVARLHAIGTASDDNISQLGYEAIGMSQGRVQPLPSQAAFLARSSGLLQILNITLQANLMSYNGTIFSTKNRQLIQSHLTFLVDGTPQDDKTRDLVENFKLYVNILLDRHTTILHPVTILLFATQLAQNLLKQMTATAETPRYNPLDLHLYALTTITLLEFTDLADTDMATQAWDALADIHRALEQISERVKAEHNLNETTAPAVHWAESLLGMIDAKSGDMPSGENGNATIADELTETPIATEMPTRKAGKAQMIDFSMLTRAGYLNVVADRSGPGL